MRAAVLPLVAGGLALGPAPGCDHDPVPPAHEEPMFEAPPARVEKITEEPLRFAGQTVRVVGEVDEVFGLRAFTLEGGGWPWDEELLVVTRAPARVGGIPLADDDEVIVRGRVRTYDVAGLERELGRDLEPAVAREVARRPVIVADEIHRVGGTSSWSAADTEPGALGLITLQTHHDAEALAGRQVHLERVNVQAVGPRALWVGPTGTRAVLVVPGDPALLEGVRVADRIEVEGTARRLPSTGEAIRRFELDPTLAGLLADRQLYVEATRITTEPPVSSSL